jgi:hypothetical protein
MVYLSIPWYRFSRIHPAAAVDVFCTVPAKLGSAQQSTEGDSVFRWLRLKLWRSHCHNYTMRVVEVRL